MSQLISIDDADLDQVSGGGSLLSGGAHAGHGGVSGSLSLLGGLFGIGIGADRNNISTGVDILGLKITVNLGRDGFHIMTGHAG